MVRPFAIVQSIATLWTKASRSPTIAGRRNAIPEVLDLPEDAMRAAPPTVAWHEVRFAEPDFLPQVDARLVPLALVRVPKLDLVRVDDGSLRVYLCGNPCFRLAPRDVGNVVYNFADSETRDGWRVDLFQKLSVHVAFDVAPDRLLFPRPPNHSVRLMRDLS